MEKSVIVNNILSQIQKLDYESKLYLAEKLINQLRKNKKKKVKTATHSLTELNSLGSEIWRNVDIDQYVQQERQWE